MPGVKEAGALTHQNNGAGASKLYVTAEETQQPEEVKIEGKIPSYVLGGKYLRVGPCKFDFEDFTVNHWLDGYAMLSKFEIKDNTVVFEKKFVQSDAYKRAVASQKPQISEFATHAQSDGKKGFFARVISSLLPEMTDNSYATLFQLGQDLFATCDTQYFHRIDPSVLGIDCKCDANKSFGVNGHCAHPLTDVNGDVYNIGFTVGVTGIKYHVFKIPFAKTSDEMMKKSHILTTISPRWSGAMGTTHSFGMTENYLILIEQPVIITAKRLAASVVRGDTVKDWLEWRPEEKNRFYIIEKSTGKVLKTEFLTTAAFYFLHFINCYEESNQIVVDVVIYDSINILETMYIKHLRTYDKPTSGIDLPYVQRFVVPIIPDLKVANIREDLNIVTKEGSNCSAVRSGNKILITGEKLSGYGIDLPSTNKRYFGRKTRYAYLTGSGHEHEYKHTICKVDLETKESLKWKNDEYTYPGEPCFVPDPKGTKEDDGVLITALTDSRPGHPDYLVVVDASNMKELGRVSFKNHIPLSLHGIFLQN